MFYDFHEVDNFGYGYEFNTPPLQYNPITYYTYLTQLQGQQGYLSPGNVVGFAENRPIQKTYNFSFGVQQDIGFGSMIDVAYVGSLGRHLVEAENLNSEPLGTDYQPGNLDSTNGNKVLPSQFMRPYQGWGKHHVLLLRRQLELPFAAGAIAAPLQNKPDLWSDLDVLEDPWIMAIPRRLPAPLRSVR